ncbi:hypothetical protein [Streptomyces sp. NPDC058758]|uniref:hypothetical protein n=1 Tax=Streptomyces sp. NPDC058758 TaxID=3346627 RepID=UPI00368BA243
MTEHQPVTLYSGPITCLERDCDEYFTDNGEDANVDCCSHVTTEQACRECSTELPDETFDPAVPWPCPHPA